MSAHTPGPWEWAGEMILGSHTNKVHRMPDGWMTCEEVGHESIKCGVQVLGLSRDFLNAGDDMGLDCDSALEISVEDRRLIVAAPELLEAAQHALKALRMNPNSPMTASEALLSRAILMATGDVP